MADTKDEKALEESQKRLLRGSEKYALRLGYKLNADPEIVHTITMGLAKNKSKYGRAYCPCFFISGNPEDDKKLICPCRYHKDDIENKGKCHCGLFVKG